MVMPTSRTAESRADQDYVRPPFVTTNIESASLKVVYVVSMFPSWPETFILREIKTLLNDGVDVRIVSMRHSSDKLVQTDAHDLLSRVHYPSPWFSSLVSVLRELLSQPVRTARVPIGIVLQQWRRPAVMLKGLVTWYRAIGLLKDVEVFDPDHIHAHWATYASTGAMILAGHLGKSFSFTAHAHDIFTEDQLMNEKLRAAAFVATISRYNRKYLRARYPAAEEANIEIVHCGVPGRERPDVAGPADLLARQAPLILSVGRHDEVKGFPTLLKACRLLRDQGMEFRCEIVGDGPLRKSLEREIQELNLEDYVHLVGARPFQEVERKLERADVFVLPSQKAPSGNMDGIPVALMEAMASGTPVISTRISGIPELVENGHTGLLVPPADPVALARSLRRMLEEPALRARCIEGARLKVSREFNAENEARKLLNLIKITTGEKSAKEAVDRY